MVHSVTVSVNKLSHSLSGRQASAIFSGVDRETQYRQFAIAPLQHYSIAYKPKYRCTLMYLEKSMLCIYENEQKVRKVNCVSAYHALVK